MKCFSSHWSLSPLPTLSLWISLILLCLSRSPVCIPLACSHSQGFTKARRCSVRNFSESWYFIVERASSQKGSLQHLPKGTLRLHFCLSACWPLVQSLKEEKGKSAASLPVIAVTTSRRCVLVQNKCAAHVLDPRTHQGTHVLVLTGWWCHLAPAQSWWQCAHPDLPLI